MTMVVTIPRDMAAIKTISSLRSAEDLKGNAMEWVKGVEDLHMRIFRAQGIVGVGVIIRMSTA